MNWLAGYNPTGLVSGYRCGGLFQWVSGNYYHLYLLPFLLVSKWANGKMGKWANGTLPLCIETSRIGLLDSQFNFRTRF